MRLNPKYAIILVLFCMSGCGNPEVKKEWLDMLATNGLAVVFAMFCIFIIVPSLAMASWKITSWMGCRIDKLIDAHCEWMNRLVESNEDMCQKMSPLVDKLSFLAETEPEWHQKKYKKLLDIHQDIKENSNKLKDIHAKIINNHE